MKRIFFEVHWPSDFVLGSELLVKRMQDGVEAEHQALFDQYCQLGLFTREPDPLDYIIRCADGTTKLGYAWADETKFSLAEQYVATRRESSMAPFIDTNLMLLDEGQHPTDNCSDQFELARDYL